MRSLNALGMTDKFGKRVQTRAPTAEQLAKVEAEIRHQLPDDYKTFLDSCNGGYPSLNVYKDNTGFQWVINRFFEITDQENDSYHVLWRYRHRWEGASTGQTPIAQDAGGNIFFLDLQNDGSSPVRIWLHDTGGDPIHHLADTFTEFIDGLSEYEDQA